MQHFETQAISLKRTPLREADQVVWFYSADYGVLRAVAKGVKKTTAKLGGACEPLTLNQVFFSTGRSMHTVCHYQRLASFPYLRSQLERLAAGSICTEVVRLLGREHDQDSHQVYDLLAKTLADLDDPDKPWFVSSVRFHIDMLNLAGYLPPLNQCVLCHDALNPEETLYYPFYVYQGGFLCPVCNAQTHDPHRVNVSCKTIHCLNQPENSSEGNTYKVHRFLGYYWSHRLESPVKSMDFLCRLIH